MIRNVTYYYYYNINVFTNVKLLRKKHCENRVRLSMDGLLSERLVLDKGYASQIDLCAFVILETSVIIYQLCLSMLSLEICY